MEPEFKYHAFLAHARRDKANAKKLYQLLVPKYRVFLDSETLNPGDRWYKEIPKAQNDSLITLVLVSQRTDRAYFVQEEILTAIDLARSNESVHRVVPIYLGYTEIPKDIPYGLRQLHAIFVKKRGGIKEAASKVQMLLERIETETAKKNRTLLNKHSTDKEEQVMKVIRRISSIIDNYRHSKRTAVIIFGDIDNFTVINKKFGTEVGNKIIQVVGELFGQAPSLRYSNLRYSNRLSNDEFVSCLIGLQEPQVMAVAEDILRRVEKYPWTMIASQLYVSVSIGIAIRKHKESAKLLLLRAVYGSFLAKKLGGNRIAESLSVPEHEDNKEEKKQEIIYNFLS